MSKILFVDGHNYMYRAYHVLAIRDDPADYLLWRVPDMIRKTMRDTGIARGIVTFDPRTPNWRHDLYPEYKANRGDMPEDLQAVLKYLPKVIEAMGLPTVMKERMEGDDLLGTLASQAVARGHRAYIATSDKDMAQLVSSKIRLIDKENNVLRKADVLAKYGVKPSQVIDWLAVCGDKVDNIPGVAGVGEKSVLSILSQQPSIRKAMKVGIPNLEGIRGAASVQKKLEEQTEQFALSRQLTTIKTDLPIKCPKPGKIKDDLSKMEKLRDKYAAKLAG